MTRHGCRRDFFGRLELRELALGEAEAELDAQLRGRVTSSLEAAA